MNPHKIEAIEAASVPHDGTTMGSFLGLDGYYRCFITNFADLSCVLYPMTSKSARSKWTGDILEAFENMKEKLTTPPVFPLPNFEKCFNIEVDASAIAVGAILSQKKEDESYILFIAQVEQ